MRPSLSVRIPKRMAPDTAFPADQRAQTPGGERHRAAARCAAADPAVPSVAGAADVVRRSPSRPLAGPRSGPRRALPRPDAAPPHRPPAPASRRPPAPARRSAQPSGRHRRADRRGLAPRLGPRLHPVGRESSCDVGGSRSRPVATPPRCASGWPRQRRGRDSNPRWTVKPTHDFQSCPFSRSGTSPGTGQDSGRQTCQAPCTSTGVSVPSAATPWTATSGAPIMKSTWIVESLTRSASASSSTHMA